VRWLYHLRLASTGDAWPYAPKTFFSEGFVHASYRDAVRESATLYFAADARIEVVMIDPRRLDVPIDLATTPRGEMPHIVGPICRAAAVRVVPLEQFDVTLFPDLIDEN